MCIRDRSEDGLTYSELSAVLSSYGLDIRKVVHDPTRQIFNTYYADYDQGKYAAIFLQRQYKMCIRDSLRTDHAGQQHEEKALPGERGEEQEDHCYNARISVRGWSARCIKELDVYKRQTVERYGRARQFALWNNQAVHAPPAFGYCNL